MERKDYFECNFHKINIYYEKPLRGLNQGINKNNRLQSTVIFVHYSPLLQT